MLVAMIGPLPPPTAPRYVREPDGQWSITSEVPTRGGSWRTWSFTRACFCHVFGEDVPSSLPDLRRRALDMQAARERGTHTRDEWRLKVVASGRRCAYCLHIIPGKVQKDHRTPISRGGSDGIDNLAPCCLRCNSTKGAMTESEYRAFLGWAHPKGLPAPAPRRLPARSTV